MLMLLKEIAERLGGTVIGNSDIEITRVANLSTANEHDISFLSDKKMHQYLSTTQAGAVIVKATDVIDGVKTSFLVLADPYVGFAKVAQIFDTTPRSSDGIHKTAVIDPLAIIEDGVSIGANAVIESGARICANAQIGAGCFIGKNAVIGQRTKLWANVTIYHECIIGDDCLFQSGAVIGSDGFGYANEKGIWVKIPQLGRVVIGNHVEIGASTTIDRGAIDDTVISDNVIIDNQVQVAHNDKIGTGTAIAGGTVFAGSVDIGRYCIIGGTSVFNGHIKVCDGVQVLGQVDSSITEPGKYFSYLPVMKAGSWLRTVARLYQIEKINNRLSKVEALVTSEKNKE
jgi:UDP-3-O-[3-hydroxymyristoyl] glucosamine N-acyltransferase